MAGLAARYAESGTRVSRTDILDVRCYSAHVYDGDCFHPGVAGHALLAETHWCRVHRSLDDPDCGG